MIGKNKIIRFLISLKNVADHQFRKRQIGYFD